MKRKVIHLIASIINETGINIIDETLNTKFLRFVICQVLLIYAIFTLIMFSSTHRENFYNVVSPATYMGGAIIVMAGLSAILKHREKVRQMLHQMDNNIFTYPDEHLVEINYPWILDEKNGVTLYYLLMSIDLLGYSIICGISLIQWFLYGEITIYIFPSWTPWPENGIKSALVTLISQHIMTLSGLWFHYVILMFITTIAIEFARQFHRLRITISLLSRRTGMVLLETGLATAVLSSNENASQDFDYVYTQFDSQFKTKFNQVFKQNVINCIKHHQLLIKNYKLFRPLFGVIFSFELASCMMSFALGLYCMVDASDFVSILNIFGAAMIINVNFFARCYIGEQFYKLNTQLTNTIFHDSNWHEQSIENQRLLLIFHRQARHPFDLFGFSIVKASFSTFAGILRSTYSFLNVIKGF